MTTRKATAKARQIRLWLPLKTTGILRCAQNDRDMDIALLLQQRSVLRFGFGLVGWDDYGGGYFVVGVEVEEFYS